MDMQIPTFDDGRRHRSLKVHVENNVLTDMLDKWFHDNSIGDLKVRSKAWAKLSGAYQRLVGQKICQHLVLPLKLAKWSRKCGCSCGYSPGWNVRVPPGHQYTNHTTWVTIDVLPEDMAFLRRIIDRIDPLLQKDREAHAIEIAKPKEGTSCSG